LFAFAFTPEIATDLERLEALRARLDSRGVLPRRWVGRLRGDLEAESIAASTSMEGVAVTVEEVRRILAGDRPASVSEEDARLVAGYRDAMSFVLRRADDPAFTWQTELILGIHDRVLGGAYAEGAGRFRRKQVVLADRQLGREIFVPPPPEQVPDLVNELTALAQAESQSIAPPVLAALVHVRVAAIHPFVDGNGRTARILSSLVMYRGGFRLPEFTGLEEWWGSHRADYYGAFACLGESWNSSADVTGFVAAHVRAQRLQVDALSLRQGVERQVWTILEDLAVQDLAGPPRLADGLYDAFWGREVTNRYYRGLTDVSIATASHDLARLESSGMIAARGAGRSRICLGTQKLIAQVARLAGVEHALPDAASPIDVQRTAVVSALAKRLHHGQR
jgi:Fic family protein